MENTQCFEDAALLIVDMVSDFAFPDGEALATHAFQVTKPIADLRIQFGEHKRPVIYVNDNFDQWRLSFPELVERARREGSKGKAIVETLLPSPDDYFVLKPKHSAFYETALPTLLEKLKVKRLAIVGVAGDSCILSSAMDAHIREFDVWVPKNGCASITPERNERAIAYLHESVQCDISPISRSST